MAEKEDDVASTTSTIDEELAEDEFIVERIIGENVSALDGKRRWLVVWMKYALHEATWEPREHLDGALECLKQWEELKSRIEEGKAHEVLPEWVDAKKKHLRAQWEEKEVLRLQGKTTPEWSKTLEESYDEIDQWLDSNEDTVRPSSDEEPDFTRLDDPTSNEKNKATTELLPRQLGQSETTQRLKARAKETTSQKASSKLADVAHSGRGSTTTATGQKFTGPQNASNIPPLASMGRAVPTKTGNVAIRSKTIPAPPNVFSGGKVKNKRTIKTGIASDQITGGKILNLRGQNLLNKHSRDRENEAPPTMPKSLRSLNPEDPTPINQKAFADRRVTSTDQPRPAQIGPKDHDGLHHVSGEASTSSQLNSSRRSSMKTASIAEPSANTSMSEISTKRKQSVRFGDLPAGAMESHEPSLFVQDDEYNPSKQYSPSSRLQNTPKDPRTIPKKNMPKTCLLGAEVSRTTILLFHNVPQPEEAWAKDFMTQKKLIFSHTCHASDFMGQFRRMCDQKASGIVSTSADSDMLDTVTGRLKLHSLGVFCYTESFCILLYPSKSEDWAELNSIQTTDSKVSLRYIIFGPAAFTQSELPSDKPTAESRVGANLGSFLNLDAGDKINPPTSLNTSEERYVFLAFPPDAIEQTRLMALWVKMACKVECVILDSNRTADDWERFVEHGRGALIIHEDALKKTRLFPRMFEVLKRTRQGHITVCLYDRALATSTSSLMWAMKTPTFGNIGIRKLASTGAVFMLAPSFIVSSPKGCRRFLKWVEMHHDSSIQTTLRVKLAVPSGILDWLMELVLDKVESGDCAPADKERWEDSIDILQKFLHGCSADDEFDDSSILIPLVTAPAKIDPSDEQSLVNWFGWWSISNLDKYSGFYVLGGGPFSNRTEPTIRLKPVQWEKDTVTDSDLALHLLHADHGKEPVQHCTTTRQKTMQIIRTDAAGSLRQYLQGIFEDVKLSRNPMFLYFRPVAYQDDQHAYHMGDIRYDFSTYKKWFHSFLDLDNLFKKFGAPIIKHTLTGFFYTPDTEDEEVSVENHNTHKRHPWIAMFRPCHPNQKPWLQTELFIWDQRYHGQIKGGQDLYESDVLPVHRSLIGYVGPENDRKNQNYTLGKVWVGGWNDWQSPYDHPVDITLDRLALFADNLERCVPFWESDIPQQGWTIVKAEKHRPAPMSVENPASRNFAPANIAVPEGGGEDGGSEDEEEWDPTARMIFHPPRGHNSQLSSHLCSNRFYSNTKEPVVSGRDGRFDYKYVPTKLWYGQQLRQGRGFEHIMVDSWQKVFDELKISWA